MSDRDFTKTLTVDKSPKEAFDAINNVLGWWTENLKGHSQKLNDEFSVHFGDVHYSKQKLVDVVPNKKIVWLVTDSKLGWLANKQEWTNTKISFDISSHNNKTQVRFTHIGLLPEIECFNDCSNAWTDYIVTSLYNLIATGKGNPTPKA